MQVYKVLDVLTRPHQHNSIKRTNSSDKDVYYEPKHETSLKSFNRLILFLFTVSLYFNVLFIIWSLLFIVIIDKKTLNSVTASGVFHHSWSSSGHPLMKPIKVAIESCERSTLLLSDYFFKGQQWTLSLNMKVFCVFCDVASLRLKFETTKMVFVIKRHQRSVLVGDVLKDL